MIMKTIFIGLLSLALTTTVIASEPDWEIYASLLRDYTDIKQVKGTRLNWVNYSKLKASPEFEKVVKQLETFSPEVLENQQERLAFYINAYNILAIKVVLDHWPLKSIKDVGNFFTPVWKKKAGLIGGKSITLNEIEHEILRPMGEARIHMAIVCASISCPDLRQEPYIAARLDQQLDEQSRSFLLNPSKGLHIDSKEIHTSKIFDWFEDDFKSGFGGIDKFFLHYIEIPTSKKLKKDLPYDWSLNGE